MSIAIIDYGAGNLGSMQYAIEQCGSLSYVAKTPDEIKLAEKLILPGVGAFYEAMQVLRERHLVQAIQDAVLGNGTPILGVCLGMQLFASKGFEGEETNGLDLIPGEVRLLDAAHNIRLPHVGWNEIHFEQNHAFLSGINTGSDFYFVHSYHFVASNQQDVLSTTCYGKNFSSIVKRNNIYGVQFHPEKSGKLGRTLIKNFIKAEKTCLNVV